MGTLIIHAGMSKTGSSTLQRWLADEASWLQAEHGFQVLAVRAAADHADPEVVPSPWGSSTSAPGYEPWTSASATNLFAQLDSWLHHDRAAVVTSEGFGRWFYSGREAVLPAMEKFALKHQVRVAYYVRPQHTALESAWRQWGFREGVPPSAYMQRRLKSLHFLATLERVLCEAPHVSFMIRPFRSDLLEGGDVVADFAKHVLRIPDFPSLPKYKWENRALPLQLVNIMRYAPTERFWSSPHDNLILDKLRDLGVAEWPTAAGPKIDRSRLILRAFCHREYEAENRVLIRRLDWPTDHFVPPVPAGVGCDACDLAELDQLWEPDASEQERSLLFCALWALLEAQLQKPTGLRTDLPQSGAGERAAKNPSLFNRSVGHVKATWLRLRKLKT